ncbi:MAG: hypothetical protein V3T70_06470 [Phycisphaerae bacterium]
MLTRIAPIAVFLPAMLLAATFPVNPHPSSAKDQQSLRPARPSDPLEAVRALHVELPEVKLDALPLDEFVAWLKRETGANVAVSWRRLERAGVDREKTVTLHRKNILLRDVLHAVLNQVARDKQRLGFRARDNVITISTRAHLDRLHRTQTYDIQDLLFYVPDFEMIRSGIGDGVGLLRETGANQSEHAVARGAELVDLIMTSVYPDSWRANGGSGTIAHFQGKLIVRNTPEVHAILAGQFPVIGRPKS